MKGPLQLLTAVSLALLCHSASADPFTPKQIASDSVPIYVLQIDTGDGLEEYVAAALIGYCGGDPVNATDPMGTEIVVNKSDQQAVIELLKYWGVTNYSVLDDNEAKTVSFRGTELFPAKWPVIAGPGAQSTSLVPEILGRMINSKRKFSFVEAGSGAYASVTGRLNMNISQRVFAVDAALRDNVNYIEKGPYNFSLTHWRKPHSPIGDARLAVQDMIEGPPGRYDIDCERSAMYFSAYGASKVLSEKEFSAIGGFWTKSTLVCPGVTVTVNSQSGKEINSYNFDLGRSSQDENDFVPGDAAKLVNKNPTPKGRPDMAGEWLTYTGNGNFVGVFDVAGLNKPMSLSAWKARIDDWAEIPVKDRKEANFDNRRMSPLVGLDEFLQVLKERSP